MRKILISPDFGAGWTTWWHGSAEEKRFMLEYQPFIDAVEKGEEVSDELQSQFEKDFCEKFNTDDAPHLIDTLEVVEVPENVRVRINEYDGAEGVEMEGEYDDWL